VKFGTDYLGRTGKMGAAAIAKEMGIGRASVYRTLG
jgi:AcrR family transcriptional regulator